MNRWIVSYTQRDGYKGNYILIGYSYEEACKEAQRLVKSYNDFSLRPMSHRITSFYVYRPIEIEL